MGGMSWALARIHCSPPLGCNCNVASSFKILSLGFLTMVDCSLELWAKINSFFLQVVFIWVFSHHNRKRSKAYRMRGKFMGVRRSGKTLSDGLILEEYQGSKEEGMGRTHGEHELIVTPVWFLYPPHCWQERVIPAQGLSRNLGRGPPTVTNTGPRKCLLSVFPVMLDSWALNQVCVQIPNISKSVS